MSSGTLITSSGFDRNYMRVGNFIEEFILNKVSLNPDRVLRVFTRNLEVGTFREIDRKHRHESLARKNKIRRGRLTAVFSEEHSS